MSQIFTPAPPLEGTGAEKVVALVGGRLCLIAGADGSLGLPSLGELAAERSHCLEIGSLDGCRCGVLELAEPPSRDNLTLLELRSALHSLPEAEKIAIGRALSLTFWRKRGRYCGVCGGETGDSEHECARICRQCGALFFPVLAPAVIVLVRRGDEILLAHNRKFTTPVYGLIAGFVEAGEDLEQTVRREVMEEVNIAVGNIRYFGSQSWPFPNSLMVGFVADYLHGEMRPDGAEIEDAKWCKVGAFPLTPAPGSIAHRMINAFVEEMTNGK